MRIISQSTCSWPALLALTWFCCCCCCLWPNLAAAAPLSGQIRTVYWNASSPIFEQARNRGGFLVQKNDRLVVACPTNGIEFYKIYWTHSSSAAANCRVEASQVFFLLECRHAGDIGVFQVTDFSPIPGAPAFDRPVFLFTPSSGYRSGIEQTSGGACKSRNLRLMVDIGDPDAAEPHAMMEPMQPPQPDEQPHQPRPSARQTPPAQPGYHDTAKLDSANLNLITGSSVSLPCPRLVAAASAAAILAVGNIVTVSWRHPL